MIVKTFAGTALVMLFLAPFAARSSFATHDFGIRPDLTFEHPLEGERGNTWPEPDYVAIAIANWDAFPSAERARLLRQVSRGTKTARVIPVKKAALLAIDETDALVRSEFLMGLSNEEWNSLPVLTRRRLAAQLQDTLPLYWLTTKIYSWVETLPRRLIGEVALRAAMSHHPTVRNNLNGALSLEPKMRRALAFEIRRVMNSLPSSGARRAFADRLLAADEDTLRWSAWKSMFDPQFDSALVRIAEAETCEEMLAARKGLK